MPVDSFSRSRGDSVYEEQGKESEGLPRKLKRRMPADMQRQRNIGLGPK